MPCSTPKQEFQKRRVTLGQSSIPHTPKKQVGKFYRPFGTNTPYAAEQSDKGEPLVRYYGFCSIKKRGIRGREEIPKATPATDTIFIFVKKCKMTWAALIKCVYEAMH